MPKKVSGVVSRDLSSAARSSASPDPDHDRHRCRESERTGAGDNQHGDGCDETMCEARVRPPYGPRRESEDGDQDDNGHEPAGYLVGKALDRSARALGFGHHAHDLCKHRVTPDLAGPHDEATSLVERAADELGADLLGYRHEIRR